VLTLLFTSLGSSHVVEWIFLHRCALWLEVGIGWKTPVWRFLYLGLRFLLAGVPPRHRADKRHHNVACKDSIRLKALAEKFVGELASPLCTAGLSRWNLLVAGFWLAFRFYGNARLWSTSCRRILYYMQRNIMLAMQFDKPQASNSID
jgi:hypothetical protein